MSFQLHRLPPRRTAVVASLGRVCDVVCAFVGGCLHSAGLGWHGGVIFVQIFVLGCLVPRGFARDVTVAVSMEVNVNTDDGGRCCGGDTCRRDWGAARRPLCEAAGRGVRCRRRRGRLLTVAEFMCGRRFCRAAADSALTTIGCARSGGVGRSGQRKYRPNCEWTDGAFFWNEQAFVAK